MDLYLVSIAVLTLLFIILVLSIFNDWKRVRFSFRKAKSSKKLINFFMNFLNVKK